MPTPVVTPTNASGGPADETAVLPPVPPREAGPDDAETTVLPQPPAPQGAGPHGAADETAVLPPVRPGSAADETAVLPPVGRAPPRTRRLSFLPYGMTVTAASRERSGGPGAAGVLP